MARCAVGLLLLITAAYCLPSHVYFVNPTTGKPNNTGHSPDSPLQTIKQAVDASRATSDATCTILLGGGQYTGPGNIGIPLPPKPTTLAAYNDPSTGGQATIDCQNTHLTGLIVYESFSTVSTENNVIAFANCGTAINATNAPRVELKGTAFQNCGTCVLSYNTAYFMARRLDLSQTQTTGASAIIMKTFSQDSYASLSYSQLQGAPVLFQGFAQVSLEHLTFQDYFNAQAPVVVKQCQRVDGSMLTMSNCHSSGDGGAIYAEDAPMRLSYCQFADCSAKNNGGAISTNTYLELASSRFYNCSAGGSGGGLYANTLSSTQLSMAMVHFASCSAPNGAGGGADFEGTYDKIAVTSTQFTNNTASVGGGFACCTHTSGSCAIGKAVLAPSDYFEDNKPDKYSCSQVVFVE